DAVGVGDAPPREGALRIEMGGAMEAPDRLVVVEAVEPLHPLVEERLRLARARADRAVVGLEAGAQAGPFLGRRGGLGNRRLAGAERRERHRDGDRDSVHTRVQAFGVSLALGSAGDRAGWPRQ